MTERVIVFTMKKVGSSTVKWALENYDYRVDRATPDNIETVYTKSAKIVTLVRDPIARNISEHFESFLGGPATIASDYWFKAFADHDYPLRFFDYWFRHIAGIDVFSEKFNPALGWKIYEKKVLVLRIESLNHALWPGLEQLLGNPFRARPELHKAKGIDRFGKEYQEFIDTIGFDDNFLNVMYNNQYCRHFYSKQEIMEMKEKWRKKS